MSHQIDKTSAECKACRKLQGGRGYVIRGGWNPRPETIAAHLQAQQALLWAAAVEALGPEPINEILNFEGYHSQSLDDGGKVSMFCDLQDLLLRAIRARIGTTPLLGKPPKRAHFREKWPRLLASRNQPSMPSKQVQIGEPSMSEPIPDSVRAWTKAKSVEAIAGCADHGNPWPCKYRPQDDELAWFYHDERGISKEVPDADSDAWLAGCLTALVVNKKRIVHLWDTGGLEYDKYGCFLTDDLGATDRRASGIAPTLRAAIIRAVLGDDDA